MAVLGRLGHIDKDGMVLLKGRAACEVSWGRPGSVDLSKFVNKGIICCGYVQNFEAQLRLLILYHTILVIEILTLL